MVLPSFVVSRTNNTGGCATSSISAVSLCGQGASSCRSPSDHGTLQMLPRWLVPPEQRTTSVRAFLKVLAVVFTALAMSAGMAHLFALPNKINLPAAEYFEVQQIYRGWSLA